MSRGPTARKFEHGGLNLTYRDWAKRIGITEKTLRGRIACGWSLEQALTTAAQPRAQRPAEAQPRIVVISTERIFRAWAMSPAPEIES